MARRPSPTFLDFGFGANAGVPVEGAPGVNVEPRNLKPGQFFAEAGERKLSNIPGLGLESFQSTPEVDPTRLGRAFRTRSQEDERQRTSAAFERLARKRADVAKLSMTREARARLEKGEAAVAATAAGKKTRHQNLLEVLRAKPGGVETQQAKNDTLRAEAERKREVLEAERKFKGEQGQLDRDTKERIATQSTESREQREARKAQERQDTADIKSGNATAQQITRRKQALTDGILKAREKAQAARTDADDDLAEVIEDGIQARSAELFQLEEGGEAPGEAPATGAPTADATTAAVDVANAGQSQDLTEFAPQGTAITPPMEKAFDFIRANPDGLREQQALNKLESLMGIKIKIPRPQAQS